MTIEKTIHFDAPAAKAWAILTQSEYSRQYMFGCDMLTDWKVGSDLIWEGANQEGDRQVFVTGKVISYEPHTLLAYSLFPAGASYPDIPENRLMQKFTFKEANGKTTVQMIQSGFENAADGDKRYQESSGGWEIIIEAMQKLA